MYTPVVKVVGAKGALKFRPLADSYIQYGTLLVKDPRGTRVWGATHLT